MNRSNEKYRHTNAVKLKFESIEKRPGCSVLGRHFSVLNFHLLRTRDSYAYRIRSNLEITWRREQPVGSKRCLIGYHLIWFYRMI